MTDMFDRTTVRRRPIDELLEAGRGTTEPIAAADVEAEHAAGALVVDTRSPELRSREGEFPGALVIGRDELEWRLDPQSNRRIPQAAYGQRIIVLCSKGMASRMDAAALRQLGLFRATHLAGGYHAWLSSHHHAQRTATG
jgi:rhodanese-related sulfurtransferase